MVLPAREAERAAAVGAQVDGVVLHPGHHGTLVGWRGGGSCGKLVTGSELLKKPFNAEGAVSSVV